ncbi:MAG: glycosyltransferase [Lachnospiraceae bacterium]|nr:glycosyltransferase [Lachnospiraceae bacterium]
MGKCLIVFTRKYPYSYGEPSFQDEVPYQLSCFEKVIVLSQDVSKGETTTRMPPKEVDFFNTATTSRRMGRIKDKIKCLRWSVRKNEAIESDWKRIKGNPVRRVFLWTFEERCQRLISEAIEVLRNYDFSAYDEVVCYSYWFFANVRVAIGISEYLKAQDIKYVRVVSRAHRYDLYEERNKLNYLPMREYLLDKVDAVYVCSRNGAEYLKQRHPSYQDKIDVGYIGSLDCGLANQEKDKVFHIVSCCRVVPMKRLERLADALALIDFSCKWTMIGGGIEGNKYYEQIKCYVRSVLAEKKNIEVEFTGALAHDDVFDYYRTHYVDVLINPSESEGLPAVIMEATSFGIPIIATDVGGTTEIVIDGENGYVLPEDFSNDDLSAAICHMCELPENDYFEMRKHARSIWEENFNAAVNNTRFAHRIFAGIEERDCPYV